MTTKTYKRVCKNRTSKEDLKQVISESGEEEKMSYLYVTENNAKIGVAENYAYAECKDGMTVKIPFETLESINVFGNAQISTQCIQKCLVKGIPISYYSRGGSYFGRLHSTGHVKVERQRIQAALLHSELALALSKKIIISKIHNQIIVLKRYARSKCVDLSDECRAVKEMQNHIETCKTIPQIMGYEGNAARIYFKCLGMLVEPAFSFEKRSRRPPKDAFNSMLSLGYSILMNEIYGKIENRGLHPYFGFLHEDRENHPTLASDLMEEWRAVIVDSLVMSLVNGHEIKSEHFMKSTDDSGVYLTKEGMSIFIQKIEKKLRQDMKYLEYIDYAVPFRRAMELQINSFIQAIEKQDESYYHPIWIR